MANTPYPEIPERLTMAAPPPVRPRAGRSFRYPEAPERIYMTHNGRYLPKGLASLKPGELRSLKRMVRANRAAISKG